MFDPSFFMYYEDIDLSIRLRKMGYRLVFEPNSIVFHSHSTSSKEWSPFFRFHVEKGRLLLLLKHYPIQVFFQELSSYTFMTLVLAAKLIRYKMRNYWELADETSLLFHSKKNVVVFITKELIKALTTPNVFKSLLINTFHNRIYKEAL